MSEAGPPVHPIGEGAGKPAPAPQPAAISIEEFQRLALRIGVVTAAEDHPNADRLLVLTVDIGEGAPRRLVAGIKGSYQAADLIGKHVVVVANMKPATLRGVESQGMVLAASDSGAIVLVAPERPIRAGSTVK
ncbi:MAG: methionine--tRNA ligase subunit beta [Candidatus Omnitrophica bacterium]|nr:methionine--tRNA ligase subunit beta [Candidatus Omnitrophota bacterium]